MVQGDITLNGVPYLQTINDVADPEHPIGIHFEPGIWLSIPQTTVPNEPMMYARMAFIPHGTTIEARDSRSRSREAHSSRPSTSPPS